MKSHKFAWIVSLLGLTIMLAACTAVQPSGEARVECNEIQVAEKDGRPDLGGCILRIAVENAYQPFNYIDTDSGEAIGYDYDIFAEVCTRINCQPEFIETSWDAFIAVMGGESDFSMFDVGADGITITEERAKQVDFSMPYIASLQLLLVRVDEERFTEPDQFAADPSLVIGTQLGTTNYEAAKKLVGEDRIVAYDTFGTAVQALINNDVDAVMIDNVAGQGYVGTNADKIKLTGSPVESEELGFIFGKGSPLAAPINFALEEMIADGKLDELFAKWFEAE